jgi:hypothetical protein
MWFGICSWTSNGGMPLPLPMVQDSTFYARRQSHILLLQDNVPMTSVENLPNCWVTFRQHLKEMLPYSYWGSKDSSLLAIHLGLSSLL